MVVSDEVVISKIYLIRNHKVMLDDELAELYQVETRRLNERVKRNMDRFPAGFYVPIDRKRVGKLDIAKCYIKLGRSCRKWMGLGEAASVFISRQVRLRLRSA